ncbi:MAG: DUF2244 domain-containing protein [Rhodovibrionaceae bacterium]
MSSAAEIDSGSVQAAEPLLFDALLTPHRSLSPRGFLIFMAAICCVSFAAGLALFLAGAWPIVGFLGADVLLIYLLFRANYRHGRRHEILELTPERLTVRKVNHYGEARSFEFQPYWLRVQMDDPVHHESQLVLHSHGKRLVVGSFLAPEERLDLAKALRKALAETQNQLS